MLPAERVSVEYAERVKDICGSSMFSYLPLWDAGSVAFDIGGRKFHGAHVGITPAQQGIGDGRTCPLYDGSNDFTNIHSTAFGSAFTVTMGQEGTFVALVKLAAAATWTDGAVRRVLSMRVNAANNFFFRRTTTNNQLEFNYQAGGVTKQILDITLGGITDWLILGMTWSLVSGGTGEFKAYGGRFGLTVAQLGTTQTGLGTWVGSLSATDCCIGAQNTTPAQVWSGYIAHAVLLNTPKPLSFFQSINSL